MIKPLDNTSSPNYINNNKINKQSNEFDVLLSHDMYLNNELRNDVQDNELRSDSKMKKHSPTPVTIANNQWKEKERIKIQKPKSLNRHRLFSFYNAPEVYW